MDSNVIELFPQKKECPDCGEVAVFPERLAQKFLYGIRGKEVELSADVTVWTCRACGFSFTEGEAEEARHQAVCHYLGVLTPSEIQGIRKRHGLTQAELAKLTQFGEASIKRWETGALIQNASADRFLRLLKHEMVIRLLRDTARESEVAAKTQPQFRTQISDETRRLARVFTLRRTGS